MELQRADREILRLNREIAALPKRVVAIEEKLAGTKAGLERAKAAVKADEATRRKYESAIRDEQQKISKYRDQSLAVKTNEQYKALLHEIQFAEQAIQANEDKILELMLNAEAREKEVKAAELELKAEMAEIEREKAAARDRTAEDEKLLAEWNATRDQARAGVNEDLLRHYERVAKFRRDQKCMGCQVMLRPQTYNEVRSGQIVVCESCQRVLYFDPATGVAVERPSLTAKRRARPKTHVDKAWFYRADYSDLGEVFFAFLNSDGSASRRLYDAHTGRKIGDTQYQPGDFSAAFAEDIKSGIRLHTTLDVQQLEEWASELPMTELDELHADLKKARREAPSEESQPSQHPAAS